MSFAHLDSLTSLGGGGVWDLADNASARKIRINARENIGGEARGRIECEDDFWLRVTDGRILEEEGRRELGMG